MTENEFDPLKTKPEIDAAHNIRTILDNSDLNQDDKVRVIHETAAELDIDLTNKKEIKKLLNKQYQMKKRVNKLNKQINNLELEERRYLKNCNRPEHDIYRIFKNVAISELPTSIKDINNYVTYWAQLYGVPKLEVPKIFQDFIIKKHKPIHNTSKELRYLHKLTNYLTNKGKPVEIAHMIIALRYCALHDAFENKLRIKDYLTSIEQESKEIQGITSAMLFLASYETAGRNSYKLSNNLACKLFNTRINGIKINDIALPFQTIYIEIPEILHKHLGSLGVIILESENPKEKIWTILSYSKNKDNDNYEYALQSLSFSGNNINDNNERLDKIIDLAIKDPQEKALFWFIINTVIYATWADADLEHVTLNEEAKKLWRRIKKLPNSSKRDALQIKYKTCDPQKRIILGKSVKINRNITEYLTDDPSMPGKELEIRTLVTGHWRHYWVGKGRRYRQRKWISPFWRGPEDGPLSTALQRKIK
jgi:hypothetical protein